jgi:hypothetical protein
MVIPVALRYISKGFRPIQQWYIHPPPGTEIFSSQLYHLFGEINKFDIILSGDLRFLQSQNGIGLF